METLEEIQKAIEAKRQKRQMSQEELNFDIARDIQEKLENHIPSLDSIGTLLAYADNEVIREDIGYGLSHFILDWVKEHKRILEEAVVETKEKPEYVLHRANEILSQIQKGRKVSTFVDIEETIKRLERTIEVFGNMFRPEADRLLICLREIQDMKEKEEAKSIKD